MASQERPTSRNIPWPIQREVRQRCGFGCVICGLPLYEYEHLEGWANVQRHVAAEITLLCDKHHREKTGGLLPIEDVIAADRDPHNKRAGVSAPYDLHYSGDECEIVIGSNRFTAQAGGDEGTLVIPIMIDGTVLVGAVLSDNHVLLNLLWFDEANLPILQIHANQLIHSVDPWDIQLVGRKLIVRAAHGKISLDIEFQVPNRIVIQRGRLLLNGVELVIRPEYALVTNNRMLLSESTFGNMPIGLAIGQQPPIRPIAMVMEHVPRYQLDSEEAKKWANEQMKERRN